MIDYDLSNNNSYSKLGNKYDYIYHFAAIIGVKYVLKSPFDVLNKNYVLLRNILDIARVQSKLKRFIFASTSEVYAGTLNDFGLEFTCT